MTKYAIATLVAFGAMLSVQTQAAPIAPASVSAMAKSGGDAVQKVRHCRRWSGGWRCHWH